MKTLLVLNPVAGQRRPEAVRDDLLRRLDSVGVRPEVAQTVAPGEATHLAAGAVGRGFERLLVAGGDGTISEAVNGLAVLGPAGACLPVGIIPLGTANVLAREIGLPSHRIGPAVETIAAGHTRRLDLGRAGERYFLLMAGFGFDAAVVRETLPQIKQLVGAPAYVLSALGALPRYRPTRVRLDLDGTRYEADAFLVVVANVSSYAIQIRLTPYASADDGWLDVMIFERAPIRAGGFLRQLARVLTRTHLRDPAVKYFRARSVRVDSEPPVAVQLDGDFFGMTPQAVEVVPQAITLYVPAAAPR